MLSEHVDYWNHLGWADPYSSPIFSRRQRDYAAHVASEGVYTPQLVVDGRRALVGGDRAEALRAIQSAIREPKLPIALSATRDGDETAIHFTVGPVKNAAVYLVLANDRAHSQVERGENAGQALDHTAVAYSIRKVSGPEKDMRVRLKPGAARIVLFVQDPSTGRVLGAAQVKL